MTTTQHTDMTGETVECLWCGAAYDPSERGYAGRCSGECVRRSRTTPGGGRGAVRWERYNADMWAAQLIPSGGGFARGVMIRREGRRYIAATIALTPVTALASASLAAAKQAAQQLVDGVL